MDPHISLIVPAYNEAQLLPRLLDSVEEARRAYARGAEGAEVIVADNASTDATARIAAERGCRVVRVEKRAIAAARNGGAAAARGRILAFVDADMRIHPQTFGAIESALTSSRVVAGATGVMLERWSAGLMATYALLVPMIWLLNIDTGVVFCRREDFQAVGGYDDRRLYAEDVKFLLAMRWLGRTRGQRLTRLRAVKAIASVRKFDQHGDWHYLTLLPRALLQEVGFLGGPQALARYWYEPRR